MQELEYWIDLLETALSRAEDGAEAGELDRDEGKRRRECRRFLAGGFSGSIIR